MSTHRSVNVSDIVEVIHRRNASNPALEGSTEAEIISSLFETLSQGGPKADLHEFGQQVITAIEHGIAFKVLLVTEDDDTGEVRYNAPSSSTERDEARLMMNLCMADLGVRTARQNMTLNEAGSGGSLRQASKRMCNERYEERDANVASGSGVRSSRGDGRASVSRRSIQPELRDVLDDCVGNYGKDRNDSSGSRSGDDDASEEEDGNEEGVEEQAEDFIKREVSAIKDLQQVHALQHAEGQQRYNLRNKKVEAKTCTLSNDRFKATHFDSDDESEHEYGLAYRNCDGKKKLRKEVDAKAAANLLKEDYANAKKRAAKQKGRGRSNRKYAAPKGKGRKDARSAPKTNAARHAKRKKSMSSSNSSKDRQTHKRRKTKKVLPAKRNGKSARSSSSERSCETKKKTPAKRKVKSARSSSSELSCKTKKKTPAKRKVKSARSTSSELSCETKKKTHAKRKVKSARTSSSDEQPSKKKPKKQIPAKGKGKRQASSKRDRSSSYDSKRSRSRSSNASSDDCNDSCSSCSTEKSPDDNSCFVETEGGGYHCKACGTHLGDFLDRFSDNAFLYQEVDDVIMISDEDDSDRGSKNSKNSSEKSGQSNEKSNRKREKRSTLLQVSQEVARVRDLFEAHSKVSKSSQYNDNAHTSKAVGDNLDVVNDQSHRSDHQKETEVVPDFEVASKSNSDADPDGNMLTCEIANSTTVSECIQKPQNEDRKENKRDRSAPHQIPHPLTPELPGVPHHLMMNTQETLYGAPSVSTHSLINNTDISDLMTKRSNELKENLCRSSGSRVAAVDEDVDASTASAVEVTEIAAKAEGDLLSCAETVADGSTVDGNEADTAIETTGEEEQAICETTAGEGATDDEEKLEEEETVSADSEDGSGSTGEDDGQAEGDADSVN